MSVLTRKAVLAAGLTLALVGSSGVASADAVSQDLVDARQERQIWTTYALSPHLRANNLVVVVQSGMVRLTGTVAETVEKDFAGEVAANVMGIQTVDNQIEVKPGYVPVTRSAERTYGEIIDDAGITAEVKSKIAWSKAAYGLRVLVDTTRGKVRLRGTADTQALLDMAGHLAASTRGVASVDNELTITGVRFSALQNDTGMASGPEHRPGDAWITSKVQSTLLYSINASTADIAVGTSDGVVTLTGKAKSGGERTLAIDLVRNVRGVRAVNAQSYTL